MKSSTKLSLLLLLLALLTGIGFFLVDGSVSVKSAHTVVAEVPAPVVLKEKQVSDIDVLTLFNRTNEERTLAGIPPLTLNPHLNQSAIDKCNDHVAKDYWAHDAPDGTEPWVHIKNQGIAYRAAGENLAYGHDNASETIKGWMISPTHKANLLDSRFTNVGFGVCKSDNFIGKGSRIIVVQHLVF